MMCIYNVKDKYYWTKDLSVRAKFTELISNK